MSTIIQKTILGLMIILSLFLSYQMVFGDGGYLAIRHEKAQLDSLRASNEQLLLQNAKIAAEVSDLKKAYSSELIEEQARYSLGYVKSGEEKFRIVDKP